MSEDGHSQVALAERLDADGCFHAVSESHLHSVTRLCHTYAHQSYKSIPAAC